MFLETGEGEFLLYNDRNLAQLSPAVMLKGEIVSDELWQIAKISKQNVEKCHPFFFLFIVKFKKREKLREELLKRAKRNPNLILKKKKSQCLQIADDAKIKRFILRKTYSIEKAEVITLQHFLLKPKKDQKIRVFSHSVILSRDSESASQIVSGKSEGLQET